MKGNMKNIEFKRFNNPDILGAIRIKHLATFFERFRDVLQERRLPLPSPETMPGTGPYYDRWVEVLNMPEKLPDAFIEAILAIEELAAAENRAGLEAALREPLATDPSFDPKDSPESLALQLWLLAPYRRLADGESEPGDVSANQPSTPPASKASAAPVAEPMAERVSPSAPSHVH